MQRKSSESVKKIQDTFNDNKSAADLYWDTNNLRAFYKTFRKPLVLPKNHIQDVNDVTRVQDLFKIKGFQFGNWVTTEDRFNYLAALYICLHDMQKVLKFKSDNIGLDQRLAITFGSRGVPGALAHFEPRNLVINISRYKREDVLKKEIIMSGGFPPKKIAKEALFIHTGGVGSFAHEYGHFLDYAFGMYIEPHQEHHFLTGKSKSVSKDRIEYPKGMILRNLIEDLFEQLLWKTPGKKYSDFAERLIKTKSDYLQNRQEIFARVFEQYIDYRLQGLKIKNHFIVQRKYESRYYLNDKELKPAALIIDKIITQLRMHL